MTNYKFQFTAIDQTEDLTFDHSLERFFNQDIESTIKEDLQNSLDAHLKTSYEPVKITLTLDKIPSREIPGIEEIKERIFSLKGANNYIRNKVEYMKNHVKADSTYVLTIEDENTKGLTGASKGQAGGTNDTFGIYAYKKGVHFEEADESVEQSRGGSHGIGKIANNAASDIHLMYFANCDANNEQHIGGTLQLIDHEHNGQSFRSSGYYAQRTDDTGLYFPYENYDNHPMFIKNTRGLKIIIPFLREEFADYKKLVNAVCDNFFVSILMNKVIVRVIDKSNENTILISRETIEEIVNDNLFYETQPENIKKHFTPLYVHTYKNFEPKTISVADRRTTYEFKLFFNFDPRIRSGRLGIVRSLGMKIEDFKVKNNVRQPFNAVLIGGPKEDVFLKSLENESHTKLSDDEIKDEDEKKNAKRFINNLHLEIADVIKEYTHQNHESSEMIDTADLIYEIDNSFKNQLRDQSEKVSISDNTTLRKQKAKEVREPKQKKEDKYKVPGTNKTRKPVKTKPSSNDVEVKSSYIIKSEETQRLNLGDKDLIRIDFSNIESIGDYEKSDLKFLVVDGMGNEYSNEIDLNNMYKTANDMIHNKQYSFKKDTIQNVDIKDGKLQLELPISNNRVVNLKFAYQLEVE